MTVCTKISQYVHSIDANWESIININVRVVTHLILEMEKTCRGKTTDESHMVLKRFGLLLPVETGEIFNLHTSLIGVLAILSYLKQAWVLQGEGGLLKSIF